MRTYLKNKKIKLLIVPVLWILIRSDPELFKKPSLFLLVCTLCHASLSTNNIPLGQLEICQRFTVPTLVSRGWIRNDL
jgi:hypothetical protein